jgi:hypothetical protein
MAATVGVAADLLDDLSDHRRVPVGAGHELLVAVDRAGSPSVSALVPDRDAAVLQPLDVGVAEEPEIGEHRAGVDLLGGDNGSPPVRSKRLMAEHAACRCPCGRTLDPVVEDAEEIEVDPLAPT